MTTGLVNITIHDLTYLILFSRRGEVKEKPMVIADYNQFMLGVDKLDQLMAYYSFLHKSVKWWRKIFWLLEVMVINAYRSLPEEEERDPSLTWVFGGS